MTTSKKQSFFSGIQRPQAPARPEREGVAKENTDMWGGRVAALEKAGAEVSKRLEDLCMENTRIRDMLSALTVRFDKAASEYEADRSERVRLTAKNEALTVRTALILRKVEEQAEISLQAKTQIKEMEGVEKNRFSEFERLRGGVMAIEEQGKLMLSDLENLRKNNESIIEQSRKFLTDAGGVEQKLDTALVTCEALVSREVSRFAKELKNALAVQERNAQEALKGVPALISGIFHRLEGLEREYELVVKTKLRLLESRCSMADTISKRLDGLVAVVGKEEIRESEDQEGGG